MTEKLAQTIKEDLIKLPKEVQGAINSSGWENISESIGKKYFLSENEINILQLEVGLVLLGYRKLDLLALNVESSAVIDKESAIKISEELYEKLFIPLDGVIQSSFKNKTTYTNKTWEQSINFIVSGGDYSVFLEK